MAVLVDYDGTIALTDVSDTLMAESVTADWEARAAEYDAGRIGSRSLMEWELALVATPEDRLRAIASAQPHDPGFTAFVATARSAGIPVEVVSDGFGFFIPSAMAALGLPDIPVVTASTTFPAGGRPRIAFPNGHAGCLVCGTCKRARVLAYQATGRAVVFIGDGASDRYAAAYSDLVFAKHQLLAMCHEAGWPYRRWTEFAELEDWLASTLAAWRADPDTPLLPRPRARPFVCGPEVWGEGRTDPPEPA